MPALTLALGVAAAAAFFFLAPPAYVSRATLWETEKLRLPGGALFDENQQSVAGTQIELLRSDALGAQAVARLRASGTNTIPLGEDRKPLPVKITVSVAPRSSVFAVYASSADPVYTRAFLDALVSEYLAYRKNVRMVVSGETLSSITAQVLRLEAELKSDKDALSAFQRTNNLVILQQEVPIDVSYLATLKTKLFDLQLEDRLLKATALDQSTAASRQAIQLKIDNAQAAIKEWEQKVTLANAHIVEAERLKLNIVRSQSLYDRLLSLLQNVDISRNIDQVTLNILEPATEAERSYDKEISLLGMAGFGGLGLGLGIIVLMALYRAWRRNPPKPNSRLSHDAIKPSAAERLEQIKELQEKGLLSKEAYDRKVEQIVDSL